MDFFKKCKRKNDMILEPLQVMVQLALLNYTPIGTKISVTNNILCLQMPTIYQGIVRWYNSDNKDDLNYLFHAIRRYYKWYKVQDNTIYKYILSLAIKGLDKLIETYSKTDKTSIIHMLSLYKNILSLKEPDLFKTNNNNSVHIDQVFHGIIKLYNDNLLVVIFNILKILENENNEKNQSKYIQGLLYVVEPKNNEIVKWIRENLTC